MPAAPNAAGSMDVLLVAAKKDKIADYTSVIAQAGRTPVIVDVDAFALQNGFEVNYGVDDAVTVLLNAGARAINVNIISGDQSVFTRDISIGGNAYTEAVQKELDLPFELAEQLKKGHAVDGARRGRAPGAARGDGKRAARDSEDVRLLQGDARPRIGSIACCVRRRVAGRRLRELVPERFDTPVERFDPFASRSTPRSSAWSRG